MCQILQMHSAVVVLEGDVLHIYHIRETFEGDKFHSFWKSCEGHFLPKLLEVHYVSEAPPNILFPAKS